MRNKIIADNYSRTMEWESPGGGILLHLYDVYSPINQSIKSINQSTNHWSSFQLWYAHRPPGDDNFRNRAYSTSDVHDTILPESMKLHVGVSSNGDVDVGEINLSEMDPEDIRVYISVLFLKIWSYSRCGVSI